MSNCLFSGPTKNLPIAMTSSKRIIPVISIYISGDRITPPFEKSHEVYGGQFISLDQPTNQPILRGQQDVQVMGAHPPSSPPMLKPSELPRLRTAADLSP